MMTGILRGVDGMAVSQKKKTVLTEPYIDSSTGKMILSAAAPVYDDTGAVLGAVGFDISLDHITKILQGYKVGRNGYLLLLSENGTFLYHPNNDFIQKILMKSAYLKML